MAAFAFEAANKVWQRVKTATANSREENRQILEELKMYLATQAGNPDLGFYPYNSAGVVTSGGQLLATGIARVICVYAIKPNTDTDVFLWTIDDVDDDSTLSTKGNTMTALLEAKHETLVIDSVGIPYGLGLVVKAYTTPLGTTDSAAADAPSGFVIVKAG